MDPEDIFPVLYNLIFIVINGYYILRWRPRWSLRGPLEVCSSSKQFERRHDHGKRSQRAR